MNTTALITHWTMDGARRGVEERFAPAVDILAAVSALASDDAAVVQPEPALRPVLLKGADADEWLPLAVGG